MKQKYGSRLDESLSMRRGKEADKKQTFKDRRDESKAMEKAEGKRAYAGDHSMHEAHKAAVHHLKEAHKHMKKMMKK